MAAKADLAFTLSAFAGGICRDDRREHRWVVDDAHGRRRFWMTVGPLKKEMRGEDLKRSGAPASGMRAHRASPDAPARRSQSRYLDPGSFVAHFESTPPTWISARPDYSPRRETVSNKIGPEFSWTSPSFRMWFMIAIPSSACLRAALDQIRSLQRIDMPVTEEDIRLLAVNSLDTFRTHPRRGGARFPTAADCFCTWLLAPRFSTEPAPATRARPAPR